MCKYCDMGARIPIYKNTEYDLPHGIEHELGIVYDNKGAYLESYFEVNNFEPIVMNVSPKINYCPMCGKELFPDE